MSTVARFILLCIALAETVKASPIPAAKIAERAGRTAGMRHPHSWTGPDSSEHEAAGMDA